MQRELEQTRMKFSLASQEIISLKAAVLQVQREKEQVMTSSSFIYKSITKKKQKQKKSNYHVWLAHVQILCGETVERISSNFRGECSLTTVVLNVS